MIYQEFITGESFQALYDIWVIDFKQKYDWSEYSINKFYNLYLEYINKTGKELTDKNRKEFIAFLDDKSFSYAENFVNNFMNSYDVTFTTPEPIIYPKSFFLGKISPNLSNTDILKETLKRTGNVITSGFSSVLDSVIDNTKKVGKGILSIFDDLLNSPFIILIVIVAVVVLFIMFKKK